MAGLAAPPNLAWQCRALIRGTARPNIYRVRACPPARTPALPARPNAAVAASAVPAAARARPASPRPARAWPLPPRSALAGRATNAGASRSPAPKVPPSRFHIFLLLSSIVSIFCIPTVPSRALAILERPAQKQKS